MKAAKKVRLNKRDTVKSEVDHLDKTLTEVLDVQGQLDKLADEMSEKGLQLILQLNEQYSNLRAPHYTSRKTLLHTIPAFWKTVFLNHPVLNSLLTADDEAVLDHLTEFDVKEFEDQRGGFTLEFGFSSNPYFSNEKLVKIVRYDDGGSMVVDGTPPIWREGMEPVDVNDEVDSKQKRKQEKIYNLFMWFGETGTMENGQQDELSLLLRDDIWPNPLKYYNTKPKEGQERPQSESHSPKRRSRRKSKAKEVSDQSKLSPSNCKESHDLK